MAGTRDRLSPPDLIEPLASRLPDARLHVIPDADHGFHVPKRTGRTDAEAGVWPQQGPGRSELFRGLLRLSQNARLCVDFHANARPNGTAVPHGS